MEDMSFKFFFFCKNITMLCQTIAAKRRQSNEAEKTSKLYVYNKLQNTSTIGRVSMPIIAWWQWKFSDIKNTYWIYFKSMESNWSFNKYRNKSNSIFIHIQHFIVYKESILLYKITLILIMLIFDIHDLVLVWGVLNSRGPNFCGRK